MSAFGYVRTASVDTMVCGETVHRPEVRAACTGKRWRASGRIVGRIRVAGRFREGARRCGDNCSPGILHMRTQHGNLDDNRIRSQTHNHNIRHRTNRSTKTTGKAISTTSHALHHLNVEEAAVVRSRNMTLGMRVQRLIIRDTFL